MELLVSGLCRKTLFVVNYSMNHDPIWNYFGLRPMSESYGTVFVSGLCRIQIQVHHIKIANVGSSASSS